MCVESSFAPLLLRLRATAVVAFVILSLPGCSRRASSPESAPAKTTRQVAVYLDEITICSAGRSINCAVPLGHAASHQAVVPFLATLANQPGVGWLFDTSDFPPRWYCGTWTAELGWTHIVSDLAIFGAYAAIPVVLACFVIRRRDVPFLPVFWLFVAFIFSCGLGHLVEAVIFWNPWYRFSALVKACTAIVSWATVFALLPVLPKALALPGLATINQRLEKEVVERQAAEEKLRDSYQELQDFTRNVLDREDRLIELKQEVNDLLQELGRPPQYSVEAHSD